MDVACQKVKQLPCMAHADFMDVCARIMHTILESIMCVAWQVLPSISSREFLSESCAVTRNFGPGGKLIRPDRNLM